MFRFDIARTDTINEIREAVKDIFSRKYRDLLPLDRRDPILIKPNLNANMNALTGNTTDLRILASVVEFLKAEGYEDISIGEGTNSGYYRNNINVITRLKVDALAKYYGVKIIDLNYSEPVYIDFENDVKAGVAREVFEAQFLINMPKLKTHFEVGMSVCLKNLMGCLVGQENKKKTHHSLAMNILKINEAVGPHLHIVDGIIAMEGLGPTRGTPVKTGFTIFGTDPYIVDMACMRIAGFNFDEVKTLKLAEDMGFISKGHHDFVQGLVLDPFIRDFKRPRANVLASFIHSPKRQKYFLAVRNTRFFSMLASTRFFGNILFMTGLRQDNFIEEEMVFEKLAFNRGRCMDECSKCRDYCPVGLDLPAGLEDEDSRCIECLYCFLVCPAEGIGFKGRLGFMAEQLKQYEKITKRVA